MNRRNFLQSLLPVVLGIAVALVPSLAPAEGFSFGRGVIAVPIGMPTWKPVDFHLFSAPVGTAESGYAEFGATMEALLPPPYHVFHPALGVGPGASHAPPYDSELSHGVSDQGFREGIVFRSAEFSKGAGVWLVWMTVPWPGTLGSSPDSMSGRIIPNALFPIHLYGTSRLNGKPYSFLAEFDVPPLDNSLNPPFHVGGHSHFPTFIADNSDFGPAGVAPNGVHEYRIVMVDQLGHGWRIEAIFAVVR